MLKNSGKKKGRPRGKPFQKGVSGNPRGRPKKEQTLQHWIDELGDQVPEGQVDGKPNILPRAALVVRALYAQAIKGNVQAINTILERKLGKVKQPLSVGHYEETVEDLSDDQLERIARGRLGKKA